MPDPVVGLSSLAAIGLTGGVESYFQGKSAKEAARIQAGTAKEGIEETKRQFDAMQEILKPYTEAGELALSDQQDILGLSGPEAQQELITELEQSPLFKSLAEQQETGILQAASATGGLRGGNIQETLSQYRPQLLNNLIQERFQNLSNLSVGGQNAAAGVGAQGMQAGRDISSLLATIGQAEAGGVLGVGRAAAGASNSMKETAGMLMMAKAAGIF